MDTHTEAGELAVPGVQGLSSGSKASAVRLVSVKLTLAVLLAEVIFHFHASTGSVIHVDPQTVSPNVNTRKEA